MFLILPQRSAIEIQNFLHDGAAARIPGHGQHGPGAMVPLLVFFSALRSCRRQLTRHRPRRLGYQQEPSAERPAGEAHHLVEPDVRNGDGACRVAGARRGRAHARGRSCARGPSVVVPLRAAGGAGMLREDPGRGRARQAVC